MLFKGDNNQSIEFSIKDYQFPTILDSKYDSNWLLIYINVKSDFGNWETVDAILLVQELNIILDWFNKLSRNELLDTKCLTFTEPNLEFQLLKSSLDAVNLRITLQGEALPTKVPKDSVYNMDCYYTIDELKQLTIQLKNELLSFPLRGN